MRVVTDGAEMIDTLFWNVSTGMTAVTSTPSPRSGVACYKGTGNAAVSRNLPASLSELYGRVGFHALNLGSIQRIFGVKANATEIMSVRANTTTGRLETYVSTGTLVATGSAVITAGEWQLVETYFKMADSGGRIVVKLDGNIDIDYTGDTKPGADTTVNSFFVQGGNWTAWDDIAINDTSGAVDNSWCGDGRITKATPDGDGASIWTPSSGSLAWEMCDEYPNDGDATFVYTTGSISGTQQFFTLSDDFISTGSVPKYINRIWAEVRARKLSSSDLGIKLGQLASGGSTIVSASRVLAVAYTRVVGDEALVNPVTGIAWVQDDITNLQFVAET